jgi:hypothetical protein
MKLFESARQKWQKLKSGAPAEFLTNRDAQEIIAAAVEDANAPVATVAELAQARLAMEKTKRRLQEQNLILNSKVDEARRHLRDMSPPVQLPPPGQPARPAATTPVKASSPAPAAPAAPVKRVTAAQWMEGKALPAMKRSEFDKLPPLERATAIKSVRLIQD